MEPYPSGFGLGSEGFCNMDKITDLEKAYEQAKGAGISIGEVWLNQEDFKDLEPEMVKKEDGNLYLRDLRVRRSLEDEVRVGNTSCQYGPGKT